MNICQYTGGVINFCCTWFRKDHHTVCSHCKGREAELYCKTVSRGRASVASFCTIWNGFGCVQDGYSYFLMHKSHKTSVVVVVSELETLFGKLWTQCQECQGSLHQDILCTRYVHVVKLLGWLGFSNGFKRHHITVLINQHPGVRVLFTPLV